MALLLQALDRINRALFLVAAVLVVVMAGLGFSIVVLRYGFGFGSIAAQELVIYLHAFVLLAASATTLADDGHVRVDIFYSGWSPARQAVLNLLGSALFLLPLMSFLLWASWGYVSDAWVRHEASADAGGLPWVYLLKSLILVFAIQMLLQAIVQVMRALAVLRGESL